MIRNSELFGVGSAAEYAADKSALSGSLAKFLLITVELLLLYLALYKFQIESELGFPKVLPFIFLGFLVHHILPSKWRLSFSFFLFMFTLAFFAGIWNASLVLLVGLGLIFLLHLPIPYWMKLVSVSSAGIALAIARNWTGSHWGETVVPILASMFMFRLMLYLFELRHGNIQGGWWERINYFFLMPNICFSLFPIIDYRTFLESYYNEDPYTIYQKGIRWMVWGLLQLLAYRVVYYYWVPSPSDVVDAGSLILYFVTAYMLLLKIAGQAYLILGILCLFGWNLPPMFNYYFLASGFSDLWRRVNLYWKNFMMKLFYYPAYFIFRHRGMILGTVISLLFAFFMTWVMHSYQYFWLQGTFPVTATDGIFWGLFGVSVAVTSVFQLKQKQRKNLGVRPWKVTEAAKKSLKLVLFFSFMCILFSFWGSGSVSEWLAVVSAVKDVAWWQWGLIGASLAAAVLIGTLVEYLIVKWKHQGLFNSLSFYTTGCWILAALSVLLIVRSYRFYSGKNSELRKFVRSVEMPRWNRRDSQQVEASYYEPLLNRSVISSPFKKAKPMEWGITDSGISRQTNNLLVSELIPSSRIILKNSEFSTNSMGMRDKEYSREKLAGTYRFALLGGSVEMGAGVADSETFEAVTESLLNTTAVNESFNRYEILNFAVHGYGPIKYAKLCDSKVFAFDPDAVICVLHAGNAIRDTRLLINTFRSGINLEYDALNDVFIKSGFRREMAYTEALKRLTPYAPDLMRWALARIAEKCFANQSVPVCLFLPEVPVPTDKKERRELLSMAEQLGYVTIDLSTVFEKHDPGVLRVAAWDTHPNKLGHQLIAESLYREILKKRELLRLDGSKSSKSAFSDSQMNNDPWKKPH